MIDTRNENVITLEAARRRFRRNGRDPHFSTIYRWTTSGCRGRRLEHVMVGAQRCTSEEACDRFLAALNAPRDRGPLPTSPADERRQARDFDRRQAAAEKQLRALGLNV